MSLNSASSSGPSSSSTIAVHKSIHPSHIYTPGPATSFRTCSRLFPQKEHFNCPFSSLNLNMHFHPYWLRLAPNPSMSLKLSLLSYQNKNGKQNKTHPPKSINLRFFKRSKIHHPSAYYSFLFYVLLWSFL